MQTEKKKKKDFFQDFDMFGGFEQLVGTNNWDVLERFLSQ